MATVDGTMDATDPLQQPVLLESFDDDQWATLLRYTSRVHFREGDVVIRLGERDRCFYIVAGGCLAVAHPHTPGTPPRAPTLVNQGAVIGEVAFFDAWPRSAEVRALTDGELVRFDFQDFGRFAAAEPALATALAIDLGRILAARLRRLESTGA
jgi:CRP-like cAMP-binding protein